MFKLHGRGYLTVFLYLPMVYYRTAAELLTRIDGRNGRADL